MIARKAPTAIARMGDFWLAQVGYRPRGTQKGPVRREDGTQEGRLLSGGAYRITRKVLAGLVPAAWSASPAKEARTE